MIALPEAILREPPINRVRLKRRPEGNLWIVPRCVFCGRRHIHGGPYNGSPSLGGRAPHCGHPFNTSRLPCYSLEEVGTSVWESPEAIVRRKVEKKAQRFVREHGFPHEGTWLYPFKYQGGFSDTPIFPATGDRDGFSGTPVFENGVLKEIIAERPKWVGNDKAFPGHRVVWRASGRHDVPQCPPVVRSDDYYDAFDTLQFSTGWYELPDSTPEEEAESDRCREVAWEYAEREVGRVLAGLSPNSPPSLLGTNATAAPDSSLKQIPQETTALAASVARVDEKPQTEIVAKRPPLDWPKLAILEPPERRWAVKGWIGFGHTTLLVGSGGIGKALIAQQVSSCFALGQPFIDDVPGPFKVLFWACEDDHDELWRRQVAIAHWLDAGLDAFTDNLVIVPRHGLANALVATEFGRPMFTPLIEELREQANDYRAEAVILDNAAQLYGGGENDRHAVTMFLNSLAGALPGRAILLLAHPARSAGSEFSGSSAWENVARTRLYLGPHLPDQKVDPNEEPADNVRYLARRKANYSDRDWRRFTYRDGVLVPDAVEASGGIVDHLRRENTVRVVVDGLRRLQGMGVRATDGSTSPHFLPRLILEYKLAEGRSKRELADAMRQAMLDGKIVRGVVGQYANRTPMQGLMVAE